jgi:hypothetical protein
VPPTWLTVVAWISLALAFLSAGLVAIDVFGRGARQAMPVMDVVWPVTALYLGPLAVLAYRRWGRREGGGSHPRHAGHGDAHPNIGEGASAALGVGHCGAGCAIGDVVGSWVVFATGWELLGLALPAEVVADFALAFVLGIAFQYLSIAPMRGLGLREGIVAALEADSLSLAAFEIGLFGWMAVVQLVLFAGPHLAPDHAAYWLLMQVGMALGFATAYPVNVWLVRRGVKEAM